MPNIAEAGARASGTLFSAKITSRWDSTTNCAHKSAVNNDNNDRDAVRGRSTNTMAATIACNFG